MDTWCRQWNGAAPHIDHRTLISQQVSLHYSFHQLSLLRSSNCIFTDDLPSSKGWHSACKWDTWTLCQASFPALGELASWTGFLAAYPEVEMLLVCRAACFSQPGMVLLFEAGGFITCLEVKLPFPRWPRGNLCSKQQGCGLFFSRNMQQNKKPKPNTNSVLELYMHDFSLCILCPMRITGNGSWSSSGVSVPTMFLSNSFCISTTSHSFPALTANTNMVWLGFADSFIFPLKKEDLSA